MRKALSLTLALLLALSLLCAPALAAAKVKTTVTLSHTGTVTLTVGQTLQLTATVTPAAPVEWKSGKAKVAAVDAGGKVTALSEGSATITAKAGGKSAKVKVKVVDPNKPTRISITQGKTATVNIGQTLQLGTALDPASAKATMAWKSSKVKVATVSASGVVTPIAEGKTKITVTTHNKKKAKITVTVVDPYKPTGITIAQGKTATLTAGQTLQLSSALVPATAKANLIWKSGKTKVATVDANGKVMALKKGKAKITVKAANNKKAKATITINVLAAPANPANYDLFNALGMNGKAAMQKYGAKAVKDGNGYYLGGKANFAFYLEDEKNIDSRINSVAVGDLARGQTSLWNIAGIKFGTTVSESSAILGNAGWKTVTAYSSEDEYALFAKGNLRISIDYVNGAACQIMFYKD